MSSAVPYPPQPEPEPRSMRIAVILLTLVSALILGFVGGILGSTVHPGPQGTQGPQGPAGEQGPAGPQGPTGTTSGTGGYRTECNTLVRDVNGNERTIYYPCSWIPQNPANQ